MFSCCGKDIKSLCEQLDCHVKETEKGVQIEITAKDAAKTGPLKDLVKTARAFCGC